LGGLLGHVRQNRLARKSEPTSRITKIRSVNASLWIAPVINTSCIWGKFWYFCTRFLNEEDLMLKRWGRLLFLAVAFCFGPMDARAQVYGTDYQSFDGRVIVLDNPPSATCVAAGIAYGDQYTFVYRFVANPVGNITSDALAFNTGRSEWRILPTTARSLNGGPVAITWSGFNRLGNLSTNVGAGNSTMTILSGINMPVNVGTGNMKIVMGQIDNFFNNSGCTIMNLHGAGVAVPF
jgi:hypothetical protein